MERDARQRVEFRGGLATGVVAAAVAVDVIAAFTLTALRVSIGSDGSGREWASVLLVAVAFLAASATTGWWVDALRREMGGPVVRLSQRSVVGWTVPLMNLFRPRRDVHWMLSGARNGDGAGLWCFLWVATLVVHISVPGPVGRVLMLIAMLTPNALILWLIPTTMTSVRAEWRRQDEFADLP